MSIDMADFGIDLEGPVLEPFVVDVQLVSIREREPSLPSLSLSQDAVVGDYVEDSLLKTTVPDPIKLRGVGGTTLFGVNSRFDDNFPTALMGKVASEEFHSTLDRLNAILHKSIPFNLKCLLCGCLCCCCTLGLSLGPVLYLSKRTKSRMEKLLESENWRLYNKLGLNMRLSREQCENTNLRQYVILIEFLPKLPLYRPD